MVFTRLITAVLSWSACASGLMPASQASAASSAPSALVAKDDQFTVDANAILELPVLKNDQAPPGRKPWIAGFTLPAAGSLSLAPSGALMFTAPEAAGRSRIVRFRYRIEDHAGNGSSAEVVVVVTTKI